ncbi:glycoside hydrolase family 6 protein [Kitasatospora arboriphila]
MGDRRTVVVLEPDGLALSPAYCGGTAQQQADRLAEINGAVDRLAEQPHAAVYLDASHSAWQSTGTMAKLLVDGGVERAQGFFLNVSNYQRDADLVRYGTQVAKCSWYLSHTPGAVADDCANQYWPQADADAWYTAHVPADAKLPHFVVDSSRNGQGPWTPTATYPDPQTWCNPPGRGLGTRPTADTGTPLLDAFLWVKVPGESDGSCTRGTTGGTDPEYGAADPAAGAWWPAQAHTLAANASPALAFGLRTARTADHPPSAAPDPTHRAARRAPHAHSTAAAPGPSACPHTSESFRQQPRHFWPNPARTKARRPVRLRLQQAPKPAIDR